MRKPLSSKVAIVALVIAAPLLLLIEYAPAPIADVALWRLWQMGLTRLLAATVFFLLLLNQGYRVLNPLRAPFGKSLLVSLPAFLVAINNFPILALAWGEATLTKTAPAYWIALGVECLAIGLFEEIAFRGVILLRFAEKKRADKKELLIAILLTSAVFGAMHLINLVTSSPVAVLMQIGYSFLIGAMCSVVLFQTANLWLCVALHAIFDFGGSMLSTLGEGQIWNTETIVLTAVLGAAVTSYMIIMFIKMKVSELDRIYSSNVEK